MPTPKLIPDRDAEPFVDGLAVLLHLLRAGLPDDVNVYTRIPDHLRELVPAVVVRRSGGASDHPQHYSRFLVPISVWHTTDAAAFSLSNAVAGLVFNAWKNQTVTPYGHITNWRESSGFQQVPDTGLPEFGRYIAVVDLLIRNPRSS